MLSFDGGSPETWLFTAVLVSCSCLSFFLNPTVYYHSRSRIQQVPSSLYSYLACLDFARGLVLPGYLFLNTLATSSAHVHEDAVCAQEEVYSKWNCNTAGASVLQMTFSGLSEVVNTSILIISSWLVLVQFVTVFFPFFFLKQSHVAPGILITLGTQFVLVSFHYMTKLDSLEFVRSIMLAVRLDLYTDEENIFNTLVISRIAAVASVALTVPLALVMMLDNIRRYYQEFVKSREAARKRSLVTGPLREFAANKHIGTMRTRLVKDRLKRTTKALLIYLSSVTITTSFTLAAWYMNGDGTSKSAAQGWTNYAVFCALPVLASLWHPVVYILLTRGSQRDLKELIFGEVMRSVKKL